MPTAILPLFLILHFHGATTFGICMPVLYGLLILSLQLLKLNVYRGYRELLARFQILTLQTRPLIRVA